LRWSMPKSTKSDAKLSEIYEQNEWHLFSRQCNLLFLSTKVLQGSVGTCVNYGRIFIDCFTANLLQSVMVKKFWKSVRIVAELQAKIKWHLFPDTVYIVIFMYIVQVCLTSLSYKPQRPIVPDCMLFIA